MKMNRSSVLIVFFFFGSSHCFGNNFWKLKKLLTKDDGLNLDNSIYQNVSEHYIEQQLDHFNPQDKASYRQRYFINSKYFTKSDGPVFLYIGGESPVTMPRAVSGFHVNAAEMFGALIFAVEHRFYGQSMSDDGLKLESLKYLTSQQALGDLAHFHQKMSEVYKLDKTNKWICFGGSYPGSLSAWFRLKYPHLVVGAVSSSAPVKALVDFQGFNNVVAMSLETEIVGGSKKCTENIRKAFIEIDKMLDKQEFVKLTQDFKTCSPLTSNIHDLYMFASATAGVFMGIVQYNNIATSSLNIEKTCRTMVSTPDAYQNLVELYKNFLDFSSEKCTDVSWDNFINELRNDTVLRPYEGIMRQWTYQTCTQFGYYQTCEENTDCMFSRYLSLARSLEICQLVYGISPSSVYDNINFTNAFYGSDDPQGSNILFVNGLIDPWHALSVLHDLSDTEKALVIPCTSHCADMHNDSVDDPQALKQARKVIVAKIGSWLKKKQNKKFDSPFIFEHGFKNNFYSKL